MQNWVIHGSKTQDTSIKHIWWHLWWHIAICQSNTSGGIYGSRVLSVNQTHLVAFMVAECYLSIKTLIILLAGNRLYQQIQWWLFGGKKVFRENKLSIELHKFTENIFGGIG